MDNASEEVSLEAHSVMLSKGANHQPVVLLMKENINADKHVPVVNLPPVRFIGGHTSQGRTGSIYGCWDPEI